MQRVEIEEKAIFLRNDKLLVVSNFHIDHNILVMNMHFRLDSLIAALTEENMNRFDRAHDEAHEPSLITHENGEKLFDSSLNVTKRDDSSSSSTMRSLRNSNAGRHAKVWSNDAD